MQQAADGIQSFVDVGGARWRVVADLRPRLEATIAPWLAELGAPLVAIKRSKRREVYAATAPGLPPLLLKRYPPRRGLIGRGRDLLGTRAAAELRMARKLEVRGLATPRALACIEPPASDGTRPSWFVSVRLIGAKPLGTWLEERFEPGDGRPAKGRIARRALDELARLHHAGIWHRDFHGGNLLLHEGEGPAARLYLIDLHSALDLGAVPARARARDAADLLHSLRYAFSRDELDALIDEARRWQIEPAQLRATLEAKREAQARSRSARAFVASSRFAQAQLGDLKVSHDRALPLAAIGALLAGHDAALVRAGRRSRLSVQPIPEGEAVGGAGDPQLVVPNHREVVVPRDAQVVVKEFRGRSARTKARAAFANAVAAQARDLPVAAPLACVVGAAGEPAFALARAIERATPLHLLAQRIPRDAAELAHVDAIAAAVLDLLVALIEGRFVHPDLSPKNLLMRARGASAGGGAEPGVEPGVEIVLVDLDPARPGTRWSARRLLRALAQLGDVPTRAFSTPRRLRFLDALRARLHARLGERAGALDADRGALARATAELLRRRQGLDERGAPQHDLARLATLHLFGNWKWTGPAEPAVAIAAALAPGARLLLGRCPFPDLGQPVAERAAAWGVPHQLLEELQKHWNPVATGSGAAAVLPIARAHAPAVVHVHLDGDHAAALAVAHELPQRPAIVRHVHAAGPHRPRTRRLLRRADLLVAPTRGLARALEFELALAAADVAVVETSVDLDRFRFDEERRARGRARLGLAADDVVFGIVARIQGHRRFELLFDAWAKLKARTGGAAGGDAGALPNLPKLVVLGRGTLQEELAREPVKRLGLESLVLLPGYQEGDAYVDALAACDGGIFLVPGTDVSCRAVREWMAMDRPVIATKRSPLPELIDDGVDGLLVDEEAGALATAVRELAHCERREAAGARAGTKARLRFDPRWTRVIARSLDRMAALAVPGMAAAFRGEADVVAALRPGRLDALLRFVAAAGRDPGAVVAFDPARSRDAVIDLFALVRAARPRSVLLEPHPDFDGTLAAELRDAAPETGLFVPPGAGDAARSHPLARTFGVVEG